MLDLADNVQASFFATLDSKFTDDVAYGPPVVYDMRTANGPIVTGSTDPEGGEATGDAVTAKNACVLTLRTNKRGRSYRGRIYLTGFSEDEIANGRWSSSLQTAIENLGVAINENTSAIDWVWCVRSTQEDGVPRTTAVMTPITSWEVRSDIPGIQRRRAKRP
jgi:hypothetical protein